jgi:hypothetical protein
MTAVQPGKVCSAVLVARLQCLGAVSGECCQLAYAQHARVVILVAYMPELLHVCIGWFSGFAC